MTGNEDERVTSAPAAAGGGTRPVVVRLPDPGGPQRPIDGATRDRIGRGLRLHYAEVLALPIPDRLRMLLDDLAACSDTEVQP